MGNQSFIRKSYQPMNAIYRLMPHFGRMQQFLNGMEKEALIKFGVPLKFEFQDVSYSIAIDAIAKLVSDVLSVPMNHILSDSRSTPHKEARHIIYYLSKKHLPGLKPAIVSDFFSKDRTTAYHSYERVEQLLDVNDPQMVEKLLLCEEELINRINT